MSVPLSAGLDDPNPVPHAKTVAKVNADAAARAHADAPYDARGRRVVIHIRMVREKLILRSIISRAIPRPP